MNPRDFFSDPRRRGFSQLIRTDDGWRIANWIWTVEPEGCPPSPLGRP